MVRHPKSINTNNDGDEFSRFAKDRKLDLRRIAFATRGDYQFEDVKNSAWLLAQEIASKKGIKVSFLDPSYQDLLISYLYQSLVRYTETHIRYATRLDHHPSENNKAEHPLSRGLASNNGKDPLIELQEHEIHQRPQEADDCSSLASAYVFLLNQCNNEIRALADYLLISESGARQRCADAIFLAQHQRSVVINHHGENGFQLRAWRKFRYEHTPVQLELFFISTMTFLWDS